MKTLRVIPKILFLIIFPVLLFAVLLKGGLLLSAHKPLWNDEIYTQTRTIEKVSYAQILAGKSPEGNACPLFYFIQKGICDLAGFHFPFVWQGEWCMSDPRAQFLMRLSSNVFMALAITAIYFFFARFFSVWAGLYGILVSFSSVMVWVYTADARPYALWFFLTTLQMLFFLHLIRKGEKAPGAGPWWGLGIVHIFLALTIALSAAQIFIVCLLLGLFVDLPAAQKSGGGISHFRKYVPLAILPAIVCVYFYVTSPKMPFHVVDPVRLILQNLPLEWMIFFGGFAVMMAVMAYRGKRTLGEIPRDFSLSMRFFLFVALCALSGVSLVGLLLLRSWGSHGGFDVSSRYFIYLAPAGIIGVTLFAYQLLRVFRNNMWMMVNGVIFLGGLVILKFLRTLAELFAMRM